MMKQFTSMKGKKGASRMLGKFGGNGGFGF
jgi:hypothetical protein